MPLTAIPFWNIIDVFDGALFQHSIIDSMWTLEPTAEYEKKQKKWPKKYHRELKNMLDNLSTFHTALQMRGTPQLAAQSGYVHSEPAGVLAIDQSGPGAGLKQTRL